ncbi:MAG TPA: hypothetical protein V6C69_08935 [Trichormus sp.]|jgi:hypothetical protein
MNELNFVTTSSDKKYLVIGDIVEHWHDFTEVLLRLSYNQNEEVLVFGELLVLIYPKEDSVNYDVMKVPAEKVYMASTFNRPQFQLVSTSQPFISRGLAAA